MARVPYLDRDELPEHYRRIYDDLVAERGTPVINIFRALAHAPGVLARFLDLSRELRYRTKLDPRLRELAILTVGRLTDARYESFHHWNLALRFGVPREKVEQLADWETAEVFTEQDRAVIRYAAETTCNVKVSDATFAALKSFLDNEQIVELAHNVAFYNAVVRLLVPLGVELEPWAKKS